MADTFKDFVKEDKEDIKKLDKAWTAFAEQADTIVGELELDKDEDPNLRSIYKIVDNSWEKLQKQFAQFKKVVGRIKWE